MSGWCLLRGSGAGIPPREDAPILISTTTGEVDLRGDVEGVIAAALAGAGTGMIRLRESGTEIEITVCSIEVVVDDADSPSAHVSIELRRPADDAPG